MIDAASGGGRTDDDLVVGRQDLAAGRVDQRVEPHRQALVLRALLLDVVRLALLGELDGVVDHLRPGLGRVRDQVLAVPEQLGVGVDRHRRRACPSRSRSAIGPGRSPLVICAASAAGHGRIHLAVANSAVQSTSMARMSIDGVLGRQPADERDALLVRVAREQVDLDRCTRRPRPCCTPSRQPANEPDGSGKTYQLSVAGPLLEEPQPARTAAATSASTASSPTRGPFGPVAWRSPLLRREPVLSKPLSVSLPVVGKMYHWYATFGPRQTGQLAGVAVRARPVQHKCALRPVERARRCPRRRRSFSVHSRLRWRPITTAAIRPAPAPLRAPAALWALAPVVQVSSMSRTACPSRRFVVSNLCSLKVRAGTSVSLRRSRRWWRSRVGPTSSPTMRRSGCCSSRAGSMMGRS